MKKQFLLLVILLPIFIITMAFTFKVITKDCDDVKSYGEDAYSYFRKAYNSSTLNDVHQYAKKGMNEASNAEDEANNSQCDCDDAESAASDAYSYGKRAYTSDNLREAQSYVKKAMYSTEEISDEAENCEQE